jgi:uncharacterized membrane protein YoaK (UPF0700 family)
MAEQPAHRLAAAVLAAIAGFIDTASFLALLGMFTAHVTGNLVVAGATIARERTDQFAIRIAMIPIFMVAVAATVVMTRRLRARGRAPLVPILVVQLALLLGFMALGVALGDRVGSDPAALFVIAAVGVLAMGIQNAVMRVVVGGSPTTIMTGNVTQLTIDLVETFAPETAATRHEARVRLARTAEVLAGFVAGAALGAAAMSLAGFWSMAIPALALGVIVAGESRRSATKLSGGRA